MALNANVYFCDTAVHAQAAVTFLKGLGFTDAQITVENVSGIGQYDGETFGGGGKKDAPPNANFLVIARD